MHRQVMISQNGHVIATEAWLRKSTALPAIPRHRSAMARLLAGISTGAAALVMLAAPTHVRAQAVEGDYAIQFGIETVDRNSDTRTDTVFVTASEALIDWNATSSSGVFLPEGTTLRFQRDGEDYTVLNRVTSSVAGGPLSIAGRVESESYGKVWFYNPGGWVVGSTGVFNVGSLVLTSLPITVDPATDTVSRLYGDKGEIRFGAAIDKASSVSISGNAQINADLRAGSYVAMVAPKVSQGGTVRVDGSAAYVAAESATMTINGGLFDIVVDSGSSDTTGISHTGTTGGPSGLGNRIYLVAVPKNQAMTAVVAGSLGYDAAVSASSDPDGTIVLSAGHNVLGGSAAADAIVGGNASLSIQGLDATSVVTGNATGKIAIDATAANVDFRAGAFLVAGGDIDVNAAGGNDLTVGGTLDLQSKSNVNSGKITVDVGSGSSFSVTGDFSAISTAEGLIKVDPDNGDALQAGSVGDAVSSGAVKVGVTDASFTVGGTTTLQSTATGGVGALSAGAATSGDVSFAALETPTSVSTLDVSLGSVQFTSNAGPGSGPQQPDAGAASQSGNAEFSIDGGYLTATDISLYSSASASGGSNASSQTATAGKVGFSFANSIEGFDTGYLYANNYAFADSGGAVVLGDVGLLLDNADLYSGRSGYGYISLSSSAQGTLANPNTVAVSLSNGASLDLGQGYINLDANGRNGTGTQASANIGLTVDNSTLTASSVYAYTSAYGSDEGTSALAGNIALSVVNGGSLQASSSVYLNTDGYGGYGTDGGNGTGGDIDLTIDNGSLTSGYLSASSIGTAGARYDASGLSGTGRGGTTTFTQSGASSNLSVTTFVAESLGFGNRGGEGSRSFGGQAGDGAAGIGGTTVFTINDGFFSAGDLAVRADGEGGNGGNVEGFGPAKGGSGGGGSASFAQTGGNATINSLRVSASGRGGNGSDYDSSLNINGGDGGSGTGGSASAGLSGGTLYADSVSVDANGNKSVDYGYGYIGYVGNGGNVYYDNGSAGDGGAGRGGNALLTVNGGILLDAEDSSGKLLAVTVNAIGEGGAGGATYLEGGEIANSGAGGNGSGGTATLRFTSGILDATQLTVAATGLGGLSGNIAQRTTLGADIAGAGGSGVGGTSLLEIGVDFDSLTSFDNDRFLDVSANGVGQSGESGRVGGAGGSGTGGSVTFRASGGSIELDSASFAAGGTGGTGGDAGVTGAGGAGGSGSGGSVSIEAVGDGTILSLAGQSVTTRGTGGNGGTGGSGSDLVDGAGLGGAGGSGTGGSIAYLASDFGELVVPGQVDIENHDVAGYGGDGGLGGNAAANGYTTTGAGGAGGAGSGGGFSGTAQSGGVLTFDAIDLQAGGFGGSGAGVLQIESSNPLKASIGGAGGDGTGGTFSLLATGAESDLTVGDLTVSTDGVGGGGADGVGYAPVSEDGAAGGAGGSGVGGTISVMAEDYGALTIAPVSGRIDLTANGEGGTGGDGFLARAGSGGDGGTGGIGGVGQGGSITLAANTLGTANVVTSGQTFLVANGLGGAGGIGGNGASTTTPNAVGGNGGDTGVGAPGIGGSVALGATGGRLSVGTLDIAARGLATVSDAVAAPGSGPAGQGAAGQNSYALPFGGDVSFTSADSEVGPGSMLIGDTSVNVTSLISFPTSGLQAVAGSVSLSQSSTLDGDAMRFASLTADATGMVVEGPAITLNAVSGPIEVTNDLVLSATGAVLLDADGGGNIVVGDLANISSNTGISVIGRNTGQLLANDIFLGSAGSIDIASVDCSTCAPVHASSRLNVFTGNDFNLRGGATAVGLGSVNVQAFGAITGDDGSRYFSNGSVLVRGAGDVTVRNATGGDIRVEAGAVVDGQTFYVPATLTLGNTEGGGVFDSSGSMTFVSGGDIAVTGGNAFNAGDGISVLSGNDIIVGADNAIRANLEQSSEPGSVSFFAGGLGVDYELDAGDIATLSFGSGTSVVATGTTINLRGAAIDARLASFESATFRADVTGSLGLTDPRSYDGGRLDPDCLEGAICVGDIRTTGDAFIGQGQLRPLNVLATGQISGRAVRISALGDVALSPSVQVLAVNRVTIASEQGNVALGAASLIRGGTVSLTGAGALTGSGSITATFDDVGLTFGGDIDAAAITAVRELTGADDVGGVINAFFTPAALRVDALTLGDPATIVVGTNLSIGTLALANASAYLDAGEELELSATQGITSLRLIRAPVIRFGAISASDEIIIDGQGLVEGSSAVSGGTLDVLAGSLDVAEMQARSALSLFLFGDATLGTATSTAGLVAVDAGRLTFDAISAGTSVELKSGTGIAGGTLEAGTTIDVSSTEALTLTSASSGTSMHLVADSLDGGSLAAGQDLSLEIAGDAAFSNAVVGGDFTSRTGSLSFDSIDATGLVKLESGNVTGGSITGKTTIDITSTGSASFDQLSAGTGLTVDALSITANSASAGQILSLQGGSVDVGQIEGIDLVAVAGTAITFDSLRTSGDALLGGTTMNGGSINAPAGHFDASFSGDVTLGSVNAASAIIFANNLNIAQLSTTSFASMVADSVVGGTFDVGGEFYINGGRTVTLNSASAGISLGIGAQSLLAGRLAAGTDLGLTIADSATLTGGATAGGSLTAQFGSLNFTTLDADGSISLSGTEATGESIAAGDSLTVTLSGRYGVGSATAASNLMVQAASVEGSSLSAGRNIDLTATGLIDIATIDAGGGLTVTAGSLEVTTANANGLINLDVSGAANLGSGTAGTKLTIAAGSLQAGSLASGGDGSLSIDGAVVLSDDARAGGSLTIASASLSAPTLSAVGNLAVTAPGAVSLGTATAGQALSIAADDLTFDGLNGGTVDLRAGAVLGGASSSAGSLTIVSTGAASLSSVIAGGPASITAASLQLPVLTAAGIAVDATGAVDLGTVTSSGAASINAGALSVQSLKTVTSADIAAGSVNGGTLDIGTDLALVATGTVGLESIVAGGAVTIRANDLTVPTLRSGGNMSLNVTNMAGLSTVQSGGSLTIGSGVLRFDALKSLAAARLTGGSISGTVVEAGTTLDIAVTGPIMLTSVDANGAVTIAGSGIAADTITGRAAISLTGATITVDAITAASGVSLSGTGAARVDTVSAGSFTSSTGSLAFDAITSRAATSITTTGGVTGGRVSSTGAITVSSSGPASLGALSATGNIALNGGALTFASASAGGRLDITATSINGGPATAVGDVSIFSDADLSLAGLTGQAVSLGSNGAVNVAALSASGLVNVSADAVSLASPGSLQINAINASNGNVEVVTVGALVAQTVNARGNVLLRSSTSDVTVGRVSAGYADVFSDSVRPRNTVVSGVIGQGDILLDAARDVRIDAVADAANAFTANAGRTITLLGLATGRTMALSSTDIGIGATAQLGEAAHTTLIALTNSGQGVTYLGDNARTEASGGYTISQAEFSRIQSGGDLQIQGGSALRVGDLAVATQVGTTGGQVGDTGKLSLASQGPVTFVGGLAMSNAGGNTLAVTSGQGISLDATTGSIRLLEGQVGGGTLTLSGSGIAMVTAQASADIANLTDTALITERLSQNDGVTADRTLVEAATISLRSDGKVYIQNTSASTEFADRRGFVATTLSIGSRDGGTLDVVINGTVGGATGIDAIGVIDFGEELTALSSVNGCVIATADACGVQPIIEEPFSAINVRDVIEEVLDEVPEDSALVVVDSFMQSPLIQLNQMTPAGFEPLIDEPVTGTGNDDMLGEEKPGE